MHTSIQDDLGGYWHHTGRIGHPAVHAGIHHAAVAHRSSPSVADRSLEAVRHIEVLEADNPVERTLAARNLGCLGVDILGRNSGGTGYMDRT